MKKRIQKGISLALVLCLLCTVFAGCGKADTAETTPEANDSQPTAAAGSTATLYIGTHAAGYHIYDVTVSGAITPDSLIQSISLLTGWDLTLASPVTAEADKMTVDFAPSSCLMAGPPEQQKEEFLALDVYSFLTLVLDSIQETLQRNFAADLTKPNDLKVYYSINGGPITVEHITLPFDVPWDSATAFTVPADPRTMVPLCIGSKASGFRIYDGALAGEVTPQGLIMAIAELTGWNLDLADSVAQGKGGMTVDFASTSCLVSGPPKNQKEEFRANDVISFTILVLDSIQETLQRNFVLPPNDPNNLDVYFMLNGDDIVVDGIEIPCYIPWDSSTGLKPKPQPKPEPETKPAPQPKPAYTEYPLYIGSRSNGFLVYDTPIQGDLTPEALIKAIAKLTHWNLDLAESVADGKGGMTVNFASTSSLAVGAPNPQVPEFHAYDNISFVAMVLDSIQKTLQQNFVMAPGDPSLLDIYYILEGGPITVDGITLPMYEPWDSTTAFDPTPEPEPEPEPETYALVYVGTDQHGYVTYDSGIPYPTPEEIIGSLADIMGINLDLMDAIVVVDGAMTVNFAPQSALGTVPESFNRNVANFFDDLTMKITVLDSIHETLRRNFAGSSGRLDLFVAVNGEPITVDGVSVSPFTPWNSTQFLQDMSNGSSETEVMPEYPEWDNPDYDGEIAPEYPPENNPDYDEDIAPEYPPEDNPEAEG